MSTEQPTSTATQPAATTEQTTLAAEDEHTWGSPQPPKQPSPWTARKTITAVAIAVGVAAVGGAIVYAGTSNESQQQGPGGAGPGMGPGMGRGMNGQFPGAAGTDVLGALHGDFTVSDGDGGYETQRMQTGKVTKVSDTSIAVTSDDGYAQTYAIDSSTEQQSEPEKGASVQIIATVSGKDATADSITPGDAAAGMPGQQGGTPGRQQPGQQGVMPRQQGQQPGQQQGGMPGQQGQQPPGQSGSN